MHNLTQMIACVLRAHSDRSVYMYLRLPLISLCERSSERVLEQFKLVQLKLEQLKLCAGAQA